MELIQEQRWDKITVQSLLDRTGISRSTFYAHYENKLDVLTSNVPIVTDAIAIDPVTSRLDLHGLFDHMEEMAAVLAPILSQPVLSDIAGALERGFAAAFDRVVDTDAAPLLPRFLAGALLATVRDFVSAPRRPPASTVAAEVERYANSLLAANR